MVASTRPRRVALNGGPHLSVAHDDACFVTFFELDIFSEKCMTEAIDGISNQISSCSAESWSSFVCSLLLGMFHEGFV